LKKNGGALKDKGKVGLSRRGASPFFKWLKQFRGGEGKGFGDVVTGALEACRLRHGKKQ